MINIVHCLKRGSGKSQSLPRPCPNASLSLLALTCQPTLLSLSPAPPSQALGCLSGHIPGQPDRPSSLPVLSTCSHTLVSPPLTSTIFSMAVRSQNRPDRKDMLTVARPLLPLCVSPTACWINLWCMCNLEKFQRSALLVSLGHREVNDKELAMVPTL